MYNKNSQTVSNKSMSFEQLCVIWDAMQKRQAKMAIRKQDRAKQKLTYKEQLNKFAQLGNVVRYENIMFTYESRMGMGMLINGKQVVLGATISDFIQAVKQRQGV